jgi:hypothetical protein
MSHFGLSIGDSFAELANSTAQSTGSADSGFEPARWFLPRKNLSEGLRERLAPVLENGGELRVATSLPETILSRTIGSSITFLTTNGFESWLGMQTQTSAAEILFQPARATLPVKETSIFGVTERVSFDGQIQQELSLEEMTFLVSKLKLLGVERVAIGFLNSHRNPQNEKQAALHLKENGFQVSISSDFNGENERGRWLQAILHSYSQSALEDQRLQILSALGESADKWTLTFWNHEGLDSSLGFSSSIGLMQALWQRTDKTPQLHLGLERFVLLQPGRGTRYMTDLGVIDLNTPSHLALAVQPTGAVALGPWLAPEVTSTNRGYEPGPMLLGRSQQPTFLDVLYVRGRLKEISGLTPLILEKTQSRIFEALMILSRGIPGVSTKDPKHMAEDLETGAIEKINTDLILNDISGSVRLTGALAPSLAPLLKGRRPDIKWTLDRDAEWARSLAVAGSSL